MDLQQIHHAAIIVHDYARSREFYVDKLELPVISEKYREDRGNWKLDVKIGDGQLEIFGFSSAPPRPNNPEAQGLRHLCFKITDMDATVAELEAKGIPCEPIRIDPYTGNRYTFFKDPDGLPLELYEMN